MKRIHIGLIRFNSCWAAVLILLSACQNGLAKNGFDLSQATVPVDEILHGGPPKDGIPSIDHPIFIPASDTPEIMDEEQVLGLSGNGVAKAYPIAIMNWHEIVNDELNGDPVVVTYCPLCGSGIAYEAGIAGDRLEFGVSGLLYKSDLLMYDRQTMSLWSQIGGRAISGPRSGEPLNKLYLEHTQWSDWRTRHPDTLVLSRDTGYDRDYSSTPYGGYENNDLLYFPVAFKARGIHSKERVLGLVVGETTKAYPFSELKRSPGRFTDLVEGERFTIHYDSDGETARVTDSDNHRYPSDIVYWFAWSGFHPNTLVYRADTGSEPPKSD